MAERGETTTAVVVPDPEPEAVQARPDAAPAPVRTVRQTRRSGARGKGATDWILPTLTVLALLVCIQLVTRAGILGSSFPTVVEVFESLVDRLGTATLWERVGETMTGWAIGFLLAAVIALPLGFLIAANRFVFRSTRLIIDFLRPIPPIAVLPLAVLLVGTGAEMKIYLVAFSALWPILFQTMYGAQDVDPVTRDSARAYGMKARDQYLHVVVPSALPYIATGIRLAATIALVVTIATELIVGSLGLGFEINQTRYADDVPAMYALILVAGVIGWLVSAVFAAMEKRLLFWHHSQRKELV